MVVTYRGDFNQIFASSQDTSDFAALFISAIFAATRNAISANPNVLDIAAGSVVVSAVYSSEADMNALNNAVCYNTSAFDLEYNSFPLSAQVTNLERCPRSPTQNPATPAPTPSPSLEPTVVPMTVPTPIPTASTLPGSGGAAASQNENENDNDMATGTIAAIVLGIVLCLFVLLLAMFLLFRRTNESDGVRGQVAFENPLYSTNDAFVSNIFAGNGVAGTAGSGYMDVQGNNANDTGYMDVPASGGGIGYMDVAPNLDGGGDHGYDL